MTDVSGRPDVPTPFQAEGARAPLRGSDREPPGQVVFDVVRRGFDMSQVDSYLSQIADALEAPLRRDNEASPGLPHADDVRRRRFATVRRGYDQEAVRRYLGELAALIELSSGHDDSVEALRAATAAAIRNVRGRETPKTDDWRWSHLLLGSLLIIGLFLIVALANGGFFVEHESVAGRIVSGVLLVVGGAFFVGGVRTRSIAAALIGVFFITMGMAGFLGVAQCHQDCGGLD